MFKKGDIVEYLGEPFYASSKNYRLVLADQDLKSTINFVYLNTEVMKGDSSYREGANLAKDYTLVSTIFRGSF